MKKIIVAFGLTVFGVACASVLGSASEPGQPLIAIPNVLVVMVPSANGEMPSADTWNSQMAKLLMVNVVDMPTDQSGQVDGTRLAAQVQQQVAAQQQSPNVHQAYVDTTSGIEQQCAPEAVQAVFQNVAQHDASTAFNPPHWYYYNRYHPYYGVYGYGYTPYYGYYGGVSYYPTYGVYYGGYVYPYYAAGYPYWSNGYYYYPYYHRW